MSFSELKNKLESIKRVTIRDRQIKARSDYILADLIGRSVARIYNTNAVFPEIAKVYPDLFNSEEYEEQVQMKKDELSAIRFKQFADTFNKNYQEV